jgi:type IV secretory pathway TraG/TraD family ATPase VirD4
MSHSSEPPKSFWDYFTQDPPPKEPGFLQFFAGPPDPTATPPADLLRGDAHHFHWAMRSLPVEEATKHMLLCGMTGSGKTTAINLVLQSLAHRFRRDAPRPEQLILFDAKNDALPLLASLGLKPDADNVWILNPYDARSAVWDLGDAVQTPALARALATLLVPEEPNATARYFSDAARDLVYAVILGLREVSGSKWTFRDLLCALDSREHILGVAAHSPRGGRLARAILADTQHSFSVISTLATKTGHFEAVAALWHTNRTGRRFTIQEFMRRPGVLVLGNDPVLRESFWPINAILLKALSHYILRQPNTHQPRHWFVLDEFRAMEKVDCIHQLLNRGRSKGAAVLLGIQSLEGLIEVYGEHGAHDIVSQCALKVFLRPGGPKTAEWAEHHFGKVRRIERTVTQTRGGEHSTTSVQTSLQERSLFLSSYFLGLPLPAPGRPYVAICDLPHLQQVSVIRRSFDEVLSWCPRPQPEIVPGLVPRTDAAGQTLRPWTEEEERRFCGPPATPGQAGDAPVPKLPPRRRLEE